MYKQNFVQLKMDKQIVKILRTPFSSGNLCFYCINSWLNDQSLLGIQSCDRPMLAICIASQGNRFSYDGVAIKDKIQKNINGLIDIKHLCRYDIVNFDYNTIYTNEMPISTFSPHAIQNNQINIFSKDIDIEFEGIVFYDEKYRLQCYENILYPPFIIQFITEIKKLGRFSSDYKLCDNCKTL